MKPVLSSWVAFAILLFSCAVAAQSNNGWIRVQSDDGELSIEVPAEHKFFFNGDGFSIAKDSRDYNLKNMGLLTAFHDDSLLSFEIYDAEHEALDAMYDRDEQSASWKKGPKLKIGDTSIKQLLWSGGTEVYAVARYFYIGGKAVAVFAASRKGLTAAMTRFLDSIVIGNTSGMIAAGSTKLSQLKRSDVAIEVKLDPPPKSVPSPTPAPMAPPKPDDSVKSLIILREPNASYVYPARKQNTRGTVRLLPTLDSDGSIPHIFVRKELPDGLVRQALFAVIRLRFLPAEKDGIPVRKSVTIDYTFDIY